MFSVLESVAQHRAASREESQAMIRALAAGEERQELRHQELLESHRELLGEIRAVSISPSPLPAPWCVNNDDTRKQAEESILSSLWYPGIDDREESVSEAYKSTLNWVYQDPEQSQKPWDSFVGFLSSNGVRNYWVTGKPGSGKSTLMKHIQQDPRTHEHLESWASGREIIKASFFFFYQGPNMQRTELGLLTSLLLKILKAQRELIPLVFQEKFNAALRASNNVAIDRPTIHEARKALRALIRASPKTCFFISIDGLDEFDPAVSATDIHNLLDLTDTLASFANVKILLSSRPLTAFEQKFADFPKLEIHELTKDDVTQYVRGKLEAHPQMRRLLRNSPADAQSLIRSIVHGSLGVFLWVRLVVASVLEGLTNSDDMAELSQRVEELPSDLHDLYRLMLSRVDPRYREQSARLLRFYALPVESTPGGAQSALGLWYALHDDLLYETPIAPICDSELQDHVEEVESWIKSRCMNLLEIVTLEAKPGRYNLQPGGDVYDISNPYLARTVTFIHRTAQEFLNQHDVMTEFVQIDMRKWTDYVVESRVRIIKATLLLLKTCRLNSRSHWEDYLSLAARVGDIAVFGRSPGHSKSWKLADSKLIYELDMVMSYHLERAKTQESDMSSLLSLYPAEAHWAVGYELLPRDNCVLGYTPMPGDKEHANLASFTVCWGIVPFVQEQLSELGPQFLSKKGPSLLAHALAHSWPWEDRQCSEPDIEIIKMLMANGGDSNEFYEGRTIWEWFTASLPPDETSIWIDSGEKYTHQCPIWARGDQWLSVLRVLISSGADVNSEMRYGRRAKKPHPRFLHDRSESVVRCTLLAGVRRSLDRLKSENTPPRSPGPLRLYNRRQEDIKRVEEFFEMLQQRGAIERGDFTDE